MTDPQFERYTIELLKGIYENIGSGLPYKVITGKIRQFYDIDNDAYYVQYYEVFNNTGYPSDAQSIIPGQVSIRIDGFDPSVYSLKNIQIFSGPSVDPRNTLAMYTFFEGEPWLDLYIESKNSATLVSDAYGLGELLPDAFVSFELRLYKVE
jgi:hypothetical protein